MEIYTFEPGRAEPQRGAPLEVMTQFFRSYGRVHPGMSLKDMPFTIVLAAGESVDPPERGIFFAKRYCAVLLDRQHQSPVSINTGLGNELYVALTPTGDLRYCFGHPPAMHEQMTGVPAEVTNWLAHGERGSSSEAMCHALYGVPALRSGFDRTAHPHDPDDFKRCIGFLLAVRSGFDRTAHPHDPDDFKRCIGFLLAVPQARPRMKELLTLSSTWNIYIRWLNRMEAIWQASMGGQLESKNKEL